MEHVHHGHEEPQHNDAVQQQQNTRRSHPGQDIMTMGEQAGSSHSSSESHARQGQDGKGGEVLPQYRNGSDESGSAGTQKQDKYASSLHGERDAKEIDVGQGHDLHTRQIATEGDDQTMEDSYARHGGASRFSQTLSTITQLFKSKTKLARTYTASTATRLRLPQAAKPVQTGWQKFAQLCSDELNFYRLHLLFFTFTPLIFAAIFYASNTTPIPFIDCLFVCVSAMTVTGLVTYNISVSSNWQQAILFFLMCIGNLSAVSITMVLIRRHFFRLKFDDVIRRSAKARKRINDVEIAHQTEKRKQLIHLQRAIGLRKKQRKGESDATPYSADASPLSPRSSASTDEIAEAEVRAEREQAKKREKMRKKGHGRVRADMIRRMDEPAVLINPTGNISHKVPEREKEELAAGNADAQANEVSPQDDEAFGRVTSGNGGILNISTDARNDAQTSTDVPNIRIEEPVTSPSEMRGARSSSPQPMETEEGYPMESRSRTHTRRHSLPPHNASPEDQEHPLKAFRSHLAESDAADGARSHDMFPRAQTIEFVEPPRMHHTDGYARSTAVGHSPAAGSTSFGPEPNIRHRMTQYGDTFDRTPTMATARSHTRRASGVPMTRTQTTSKRSGFGGFPTPIEIAGNVFKRVMPHVQDRFQRSTTLARTATYASGVSATPSALDDSIRYAPYLSFDVFVSRNSRFHELSETQRDELGGVEYRAIDLLAKLLPAYIIGILGFFIVLVTPWATSKSAGALHNVLASQSPNVPGAAWTWIFNVLSAYTNTGFSLIDSSMTQLATQYFMLIPMAFLILAGNTGFPIFLRFFIWCISIFTPRKSRTYETLRFLLDHPRRCFVYLFPSAQTWFLLLVLIVLNSTDWIFFQVLDLGNPVIESWGIGQRIFDGLFQSFAVRAAGFQIISLLQVAPALQFLYIVMMYISAYPIAMSVRNTNVYEEKSLGIYNNEEDQMAEEPDSSGGARVWGTYLAAHARRQLAFDMWWLGFALWLVCIIERDSITDPTSDGWFTVFTCLFELTSAYGTVGLSTGTPVDDFSLSGRFRTLSKLVVIAVMLRGRHRGLPVAIDRAVMLPDELAVEDELHDARPRDDDGASVRPRSMSMPNFADDDKEVDPDDEDQKFAAGPSYTMSGYLPRSATGVSFSSQTRGFTRYLARDKTPPAQFELDEVTRDSHTGLHGSKEAGTSTKDDEHSSHGHDGLAFGAHYGNASQTRPNAPRHLTAITESATTPGETPTPSEHGGRYAARGHGILDGTPPGGTSSPLATTNGKAEDGGTLGSSPNQSSSSVSSGSRKGKERQHVAESASSAKDDAEEQRLRERYGCPT